MNNPILTGYNLLVQVRKQIAILDIPAFSLNTGETLALIGPNGAGKSTLIQVLALLKPATSGYLEFKGSRINQRDALSIRRQMAVVFQEPLLLNTTVFENVALGLKLRGVPKKLARSRVGEWLERLEIQELAQRSPLFLSGGEAQRVSLARAFVLEPQVLFLDEPFSSLDTPTRTRLIMDLKKIISSTGVSTVFVTHNYPDTLVLADRVLELERGKLVQQGTPQAVLGNRLL